MTYITKALLSFLCPLLSTINQNAALNAHASCPKHPPNILLSVHMLNLATVVALLVYVCILQGISYSGGVPHLRKPGVWGYISTALQWTIDAESVILESRSKFSQGGAGIKKKRPGVDFFVKAT